MCVRIMIFRGHPFCFCKSGMHRREYGRDFILPRENGAPTPCVSLDCTGTTQWLRYFHYALLRNTRKSTKETSDTTHTHSETLYLGDDDMLNTHSRLKKASRREEFSHIVSPLSRGTILLQHRTCQRKPETHRYNSQLWSDSFTKECAFEQDRTVDDFPLIYYTRQFMARVIYISC